MAHPKVDYRSPQTIQAEEKTLKEGTSRKEER